MVAKPQAPKQKKIVIVDPNIKNDLKKDLN